MGGILVFAEQVDGVFKKTAFELLGKGKALAAELGVRLDAVVLGEAPAASLGAVGAARVFQVAGDFSNYATHDVVAALQLALSESGADVLLAAASFAGKDALPRLTARLGTGQASECTNLRVDAGVMVGTRPIYAGKAFVDVRINRSPAVFTVRPNSFGQPETGADAAEVVGLSLEAAPEDGLRIVERKAPQNTSVDLAEAERIVSGGRSLRSEENFDSVIRPLAKALGATAGASRAAVDAGYAPHGDQVGQTGKTVNPSLYIACGISGAIQHLAGMRTSKVIVAINKDPEAPIFEHATYGIVDDLFEVCPLLQRELESVLQG